MEMKNILIFDLVDLPAEGIKLRGSAKVADLKLESDDRFEFNDEFEYDLSLTDIGSDSVLLLGKINGKTDIVCDRCNQKAEFKISLPELCHRYENAYGKELDLTNKLREDILLSLPQKVLCREDCAGLCYSCAADLNEGPCDCEEIIDEDFQAEDPWAALDAFEESK
jgi:uncharacterized protein